MAMLNKLCSVHRITFPVLTTAYRCGILSCPLRHRSMFVEADALGGLTTELAHKKSDKCGNLSVDSMHVATVTPYIDDVKYLNRRKIDSIFQGILDEYDINKMSLMVKECVKHENCPSVSILTDILSFLAQYGDADSIKDLTTLCENTHPNFVASNSHFNHYLAEAIWLKGNIIKAIALFGDVYKTNTSLRRPIRLALRYLINEKVSNRSEAVLVNLIKFSEDLVEQYKDYYPMICLWQVCFLSEWYSDQCLALNMFEKNLRFCKAMESQVPFVVSASLKRHKTEPVYRLLEVLLKYDFKLQCSIVLVALFDYRYRQGDLMCCLEIYNWSVEYNLILPTIQHEKLLNLLLNQTAQVNKTQKQPISPTTYPLKF